jgi:hypothetical protein
MRVTELELAVAILEFKAWRSMLESYFSVGFSGGYSKNQDTVR